MLSTLLPFPLLVLLVSAANSQNSTCPQHLYNIQIFSHDPLVVYIPNFITASEAAHIHSTTLGKFSSSQIADESGQQHLASTRTSRSTSLASDEIVRCIEERALQFQGYDTPRENLEPLQAVQYGTGENYHAHTDWFTSAAQTAPEYGGNRVSSFFIYVSASSDIVGGGTQFPLLDAPVEERWCEVLNCDAPWYDGVVFRPIEGNAVFWRNMVKGVGDRRTLHAGLPVQRGTKMGMNVWTREGALDPKFRSEVV